VRNSTHSPRHARPLLLHRVSCRLQVVLVHPSSTHTVAQHGNQYDGVGGDFELRGTQSSGVKRGGRASFGGKSQRPWIDIDSNLNDLGSCCEYAVEIYENLKVSERLRRPGTTYMESVQTDINPAMRSILVDWLVEVGLEYRLSSDTLFMSVAFIDRFLSLRDVKRQQLQLVGITSMLVASKYEEIYAPQIDEFCFITDNTYNREEVLNMEKDLLRLLEFDLTQPTTKTFLRRYIKAASAEISLDVVFEFLVSYLAELTLMDYSLLKYLPSQIAASCILLGLFLLGKPRWSGTLSHYSSFVPKDLKQCTQTIHKLFLSAKTSALPASREKYASPKYGAVSEFGAPETLPDWLFQ
jgi:cyclin A